MLGAVALTIYRIISLVLMTEVHFGLLTLPPQAAERIDFSLEPGVVLFAILLFVLVNLLLAAVLYPYFKSSSSVQESGPQDVSHSQKEVVPDPDEPLEERVDEFLEEIHGKKSR